MPDDKPIDRRRFFRQGLRELLKPLSNAMLPMEHVARQLGALEPGPSPSPAAPPTPRVWLRPPGALPEKLFQQTCSRCGECVKVCPAQCIKLDATGREGNGVPYIEVDEMPCVLCDGLLCMPSCPTGALVPTPLNEIDMGTAQWHEQRCVRTFGEACTLCIDHCPVGSAALELREGKVHVNNDHCTGCGVCEHECPTEPKSITVTPRAAR